MEFKTSNIDQPNEINNENKGSQESEIKLLVSTLPKHEEIPGLELALYQGCWHPTKVLPTIIRAQRHFKARDTDIILSSKPKCGTTWLKALVYSTLHRTKYNNSNHPLLTKNPHEVVPFFMQYYTDENQLPDLSCISSPRVFGTHDPYEALSDSVKESECKIVYIARNPFDVLVSGWYYVNSNVKEESNKISLETYIELYCRGTEPGGPYWYHVLGYWKQSLERPNKVLFLKYEDLIEDGVKEMKRMAKFLGCEFSLEEEKQGVIDEILKLCSFKNLKELEVNKMGSLKINIILRKNNEVYFRKGEIGDWVNRITPSMFERLDQVMKEKFGDSGLEFKIHPSK